MSRMFGLAVVQMSVVAWDAKATTDKVEKVVRGVKKSFPWIQMVVFHELAIPGVVQFENLPPREQWSEIVQPIPGPITDRLCALARQQRCWLVPGSLYERVGSDVYNTSVMISPEGEIVARYRKMFPWFPHEAETKAGDDFCVFDIPDIGRFGISICYDMWFPEMIRTLTWMGAEVIIHPTLTTTSDRELEVILSQSHAITNQCYFIDVNGIGSWGGGHSLIVDPDGRVIQRAGTNETVMTEMLDLDRVTRSREYGTLGMTQTLKALRARNIRFPPYEENFAEGEVFDKLGDLKQHKKLT